MQDLFWRLFYSRWPKNEEFAEGYTILAMVPGDLPVFLKIAMHVLATQRTEKLKEILIIPDQMTDGIMRAYRSLKRTAFAAPLRLVRLGVLDELITRSLKSPWHNNWLQFIRGVEHSKTRHILWHDADLFILNPSFAEDHYRACAAQEWDILGVSPVWDPWYQENGFQHLVSTWEIMIDAKWARSYRPWQHHGHKFTLRGKRHASDITLLPQCLTAPSKIVKNENAAASFIHFNHVIGTYRTYQKHKGSYHDDSFRILLIRLLVEMFDPQGDYPLLPSSQQCAEGLRGGYGRILYSGESARRNYPEFRKKLEDLFKTSLMDGPMRARAEDVLSPFDRELLGVARDPAGAFGASSKPPDPAPQKHAQIEKYNNWPHFVAAWLYRFFIRLIAGGLVSWRRDHHLKDGCTAIIGLCSRLPWILSANLRGLRLARWPGLQEVIVVVDRTKNDFFLKFEQEIREEFKDLNVRFLYYTPWQYFVAEILKYPYLYCWLSWCLALREVGTRVVFIHDYDALIVGDVLRKRYEDFLKKESLYQGIYWYWVNGFVPEDRMASTFEAFVDTSWARSKRPIDLFNKVGVFNGRRVDFDIFLFMQKHFSREDQRYIVNFDEEQVIHPTQMIHQYTMFRRHPGKPWFCSAVLMIPFFCFLGGEQNSIKKACEQIRSRPEGSMVVELLADGCLMNFSRLDTQDLNRMIRLMVQGFVTFKIGPFPDFKDYGNSLYDLIQTPIDKRWVDAGFTKAYCQWIERLLKDE